MAKKLNLMIGICLILTIFSISIVLGFGVSSSYWKGNPLTAYPGQTTTATLALQNMVGDNDIQIKAEITKGQEIASLDETDYLVKAGTKDTIAPIKIKIPSNVTINTTYEVVVSFLTVTSGVGGGVVFGTGVDKSFDVLVIAQPPEEKAKIPGLLIGIIIAIIIILVIIIILLKRRRK